MQERLDHPPFGLADLTNCERELIHLPGSIQPHGLLMVLSGTGLRIEQVTENAELMLGVHHEALLGKPVDVLGGSVPAAVRNLATPDSASIPHPFHGTTAADGLTRGFEGLLHRLPEGGFVVELEPANLTQVASLARTVPKRLADAIARIGAAPTLSDLADEAVLAFRALIGYDRVMVYRFDADGHGEVISEARNEELEPYLGLHYPATDIPQRARELYIRNRVRLLVDVNYEPVALVPQTMAGTGADVDMSMCYLRSMSPLHLQYLRNMGVTSTLVASLIFEGRLWGLIACHHYRSRRMSYPLRAGCELLAEAISTRITVLENYAHTRAEVLVRRLEYGLIEATAAQGDWRRALFDEPQTLLRMVGARGVVLAYDDEVLTAGDVPATPDVRRLISWIATHNHEPIFASRSLKRDHADFQSLHPTGAGVLAVEISRTDHEYLLWFRPEQVEQVQWAGDPKKPMLPGSDPRDLSPRRSFAVWTEQVQGTAMPWTPADLATARAVGMSLRDIVLQVRAMSLLLAEHRLSRIRRSVQAAEEAVLVADASGHLLHVNAVWAQLLPKSHVPVKALGDLPALFTDSVRVRALLGELQRSSRGWQGELLLDDPDTDGIPVAVRADAVGTGTGPALGFILVFTDLRVRRRSHRARERLQQAIANARVPVAMPLSTWARSEDFEALMRALLANANVAMQEITDDVATPAVAIMLQGVEESTKRSAEITRLMQTYSADKPAT